MHAPYMHHCQQPLAVFPFIPSPCHSHTIHPSLITLSDIDPPSGDAMVPLSLSTGSAVTSSPTESSAPLYQPKVSTWGAFPRPNNISEAYGGGRNIAPGQVFRGGSSIRVVFDVVEITCFIYTQYDLIRH